MRSIDTVRACFSGKTLALIGGDRRDQQASRIREAFDLARTIWIETRDSDASSRRFESALRSGEIDIVVLMLGLVRHQHARDVRALCKKLKIPVVTAWRTPSPGPLADAIVRAIAA